MRKGTQSSSNAWDKSSFHGGSMHVTKRSNKGKHDTQILHGQNSPARAIRNKSRALGKLGV